MIDWHDILPGDVLVAHGLCFIVAPEHLRYSNAPPDSIPTMHLSMETGYTIGYIDRNTAAASEIIHRKANRA